MTFNGVRQSEQFNHPTVLDVNKPSDSVMGRSVLQLQTCPTVGDAFQAVSFSLNQEVKVNLPQPVVEDSDRQLFQSLFPNHLEENFPEFPTSQILDPMGDSDFSFLNEDDNAILSIVQPEQYDPGEERELVNQQKRLRRSEDRIGKQKLSKEELKLRRIKRNRESAKRSREKQREYFANLEREVVYLRKKLKVRETEDPLAQKVHDLNKRTLKLTKKTVPDKKNQDLEKKIKELSNMLAESKEKVDSLQQEKSHHVEREEELNALLDKQEEETNKLKRNHNLRSKQSQKKTNKLEIKVQQISAKSMSLEQELEETKKAHEEVVKQLDKKVKAQKRKISELYEKNHSQQREEIEQYNKEKELIIQLSNYQYNSQKFQSCNDALSEQLRLAYRRELDLKSQVTILQSQVRECQLGSVRSGEEYQLSLKNQMLKAELKLLEEQIQELRSKRGLPPEKKLNFFLIT